VKYLIDTSALVRILRGQVDPAWRRFAATSRFAICEPVLCEALSSVGKNQGKRVEANLLAGNQFVPAPDATWDYVRGMRRDLMDRSMHNMFGVADYLIAAIAMQLKLPVLHEDKDFIAAAKIFPQLREQRITTSLPEE
jgi:predicted nucleic acid-binding protein